MHKKSRVTPTNIQIIEIPGYVAELDESTRQASWDPNLTDVKMFIFPTN